MDDGTENESVANECVVNEPEDVIVAADKVNESNHKGNEAAAVSTSVNQKSDEGAADLASDRSKTSKLCGESCALLRKKYEDLKQSHIKLSVRHCELVMKYDELVNAKTNTNVSHLEASDMLSSTGDVFTANEIRILESLPLEKKKDLNFILQCVQYAYKENPSVLVSKTLKGTLEKIEILDGVAVEVRPAKSPVTPEKVKRIEELFIKRVTASKCLAVEFGERIKPKYMNRLIATAITNISNKVKPSDNLLKENVNLNL